MAINRPKDYIPLPRNPLFQQRSGEFKHLGQLLSSYKARMSPLCVGLVGMGDVGKTQLAIQFADRYKDLFPAGVFWMSAPGTNINVWQHRLAKLAFDTNYLPLDDDPTSIENERRRALHISHYLASHADALLILDNVEKPELITFGLPYFTGGGKMACTILYTSQHQSAPPHIVTYPVKLLTKNASLRLLLNARSSLLTKVLSGSQDDEAQAVHAICQMVEGLPLALLHLQGLLTRSPYLSLIHLFRTLQDRGVLDVANNRYFDADSLFVIFDLSWQQVHNEPARKVFKLASLFPETTPIEIWLLGLATGLGEKNDILEPFGEALLELQELSLVEDLSEDQVRLHPLVRKFGQSLVEDELLAEARERLTDKFANVNKLEQRARKEGYWKCLERVQEVAVYVQLLGIASAKIIEQVGHWLARESSLLGTGELWPAKIPGLFYQQLYNRSLEEGQKLLAPVSPGRWIRQVEQVGAEDRALSRELKHPDVVTSVAFSSNDRALITGCNDGATRIWDVSSGKEMLCFKGQAPITSVAFSLDNHKIAAGSLDKTVQIWDGDTGQALQTFKGGSIESVAFSPEGEKVAASSTEGIVWIWDIGTGQVVSKLVEGWDLHEDHCLTDLAFSPDGETLATISASGWVTLWDVAKEKKLDGLEGCQGRKASISFSSDGKLLGAGSYEGVVIWDVETKECLAAKFYPNSVIESVSMDAITKPALLPDDLDYLAVRTDDKRVEVLFLDSIETGGYEEKLSGHREHVTSVSFSHDGALVATGSKIIRHASGHYFQRTITCNQ